VRRLKDELAECKSEYANLEVVAAEAERLHAGTLLAMEAKYMSPVSSLEDELRSVVAAGHAACQAAYAQPGEPSQLGRSQGAWRRFPSTVCPPERTWCW
jgi:hypothetical protein